MDNKDYKISKDWILVASLCLGIASVFFWEFSLVPILAVVLGVIGLVGGSEKKWKAWVGIVLGVVFLVVRFSQGHMDRGFVEAPSRDNMVQQAVAVAPQDARIVATPPADTSSPSITNPDYLQNPSAYLVDKDRAVNIGLYDDGVTSIWVEDIYSPIGLKVTYVEEKGGQKILGSGSTALVKLENYIVLPNVMFSNTLFSKVVTTSEQLQCWETGAKEYLRTNVLHKRIKFTKSEPNASIDTVLVDGGSGVPTVDLLGAIISSGYGVPKYNEQDFFLRGETKNDPEAIYMAHLLDLAGVAYLAKRGLWGLCQ